MTNKATNDYIKAHLHDDVNSLALKGKPAEVDGPYAIRQIAAWQVAYHKIPLWSGIDDITYPQHLPLEQCSSQTTAEYKSRYIHTVLNLSDYSMVDLTGGLGIDCSFIAQYAQHAEYVEQNTELCTIAAHNFNLLKNSHLTPLSIDINVNNTTAEDYIQHSLQRSRHFDIAYIDPARRGKTGQKLVSVADCQPNVVALQEDLLRIADTVIIKLSPMLDITKALNELKNITEVLVISVANECKELLFIMQPTCAAEAIITAVELSKKNPPISISSTMSSEKEIHIDYSTPLRYLYEPNAACMKSGLYCTIAGQFGVAKLSRHAHLYTSEQPAVDFPGRSFEITSWFYFDKTSMKTLASTTAKANITTRHFPMSAVELHHRFKIKEGGDVYIFASTDASDKRLIIVCRRIAL